MEGAAPWIGGEVCAVVVLAVVVLYTGCGTPVATTMVVLWTIAGGAEGLEDVSMFLSVGF